tara:strand:+ start:6671 stop:7123 length:453 start_codon:yes stop_codon:yes gene_type:complete
MNCIECNKSINKNKKHFMSCDGLVCGLVCSRNRVMKIQKMDPLMNNPEYWNNIKAENNKIKKNKSKDNLEIIGMPYESINLNKPIPFIKASIIQIDNYKDETEYNNSNLNLNLNLNNKISEILVKGSIIILIGLYLKKQYFIITPIISLR